MVFVPDVFDPEMAPVAALSVSVEGPETVQPLTPVPANVSDCRVRLFDSVGLVPVPATAKTPALVLMGLPPVHEPFAFMSVLVLFQVTFAACAAGDPRRATTHAAASHEPERAMHRRAAVMSGTSQTKTNRKDFTAADRQAIHPSPVV